MAEEISCKICSRVLDKDTEPESNKELGICTLCELRDWVNDLGDRLKALERKVGIK